MKKKTKKTIMLLTFTDVFVVNSAYLSLVLFFLLTDEVIC